MDRLFTMLSIVALLAVATGCEEEPAGCDVDVPLVASCGVAVPDAVIRLGDARADVQALIGEPDDAWTLAGVASNHTYPSLGLSVLYPASGGDTVDGLIVHDHFGGTTADGLGIGSPEADVLAALGDGERDAYLGSVWYLDRGIAFEFADGAVSRVHVIAADGGE